jgi:hypothetical protein
MSQSANAPRRASSGGQHSLAEACARPRCQHRLGRRQRVRRTAPKSRPSMNGLAGAIFGSAMRADDSFVCGGGGAGLAGPGGVLGEPGVPGGASALAAAPPRVLAGCLNRPADRCVPAPGVPRASFRSGRAVTRRTSEPTYLLCDAVALAVLPVGHLSWLLRGICPDCRYTISVISIRRSSKRRGGQRTDVNPGQTGKRSPLTESNRRPSPYHHKPGSPSQCLVRPERPKR